MPLVTCPCEEMAPMKQVQRDGVEIDVCTKCRGVWLDRGELEKLLAVVTRQAEAPPPPAQQAAAPYPPQGQNPGYGERGEAGEYGERGEYGESGKAYIDPRTGAPRKKRFDIFDIFD